MEACSDVTGEKFSSAPSKPSLLERLAVCEKNNFKDLVCGNSVTIKNTNESERERDGQRDRVSETERETQTDGQRETGRDRHTERHTYRKTCGLRGEQSSRSGQRLG